MEELTLDFQTSKFYQMTVSLFFAIIRNESIKKPMLHSFCSDVWACQLRRFTSKPGNMFFFCTHRSYSCRTVSRDNEVPLAHCRR